MAEDIDIEFGDRRMGSIRFVRDPNRLQGVRSASGFEIQVPIILTLLTSQRDAPRIMVSDLQGKVFVKAQDDSLVGVGTLSGQDWETAGISSGDSCYYPREKSLEWRLTTEDIAYIERARDGRAPKLQVSLRGEWCFLISMSEMRLRGESQASTGASEIRSYSSWYCRTDPMRVVSSRGYVEVSYSREVWLELVRRIGVAENVLVEVPLPTSPTSDWDAVWRALIDARNAFEQGGTTGWKGCVTSVRLALEKWRKLEVEKPGPGWQATKMVDRELWTKKERLDALRWCLLQLGHLGAHTGAEEWSRDDALLLLSTLSALLAERKP